MKTVFAFIFFSTLSFGQITWNKEENSFFSVWIDPTFQDAGEQFGLTFSMDYNKTFAEYSISHYSTLDPSYTDLVVTYGISLDWKKLDFYTGGRLGFIYRDISTNNSGNRFAGLTGLMIRFQYPIYNGLHFGLQFWLDYRGDLGNDFFRENGAFYITYKL